MKTPSLSRSLPSLSSLSYWAGLFRPGDVGVLLLALLLCMVFAQQFWQGGAARTVQVRAAGKLLAEFELAETREFVVSGPLGETVIEIDAGRARVARDPGPRQYCVQQGWLTQAGAVAICAPNQVSIQLRGASQDHDSLAY